VATIPALAAIAGNEVPVSATRDAHTESHPRPCQQGHARLGACVARDRIIQAESNQTQSRPNRKGARTDAAGPGKTRRRFWVKNSERTAATSVNAGCKKEA